MQKTDISVAGFSLVDKAAVVYADKFREGTQAQFEFHQIAVVGEKEHDYDCCWSLQILGSGKGD